MDFDSIPTEQPDKTAPTSFDAIPDQISGQESSFDDMPDDSDKYKTGGQQAIAGLEGVAQGVAGPLATLAETKLLGVKPEDIAGREHANPWTHRGGEAVGLVGSSLLGVGELSAIAKGAEAAANVAKLGKFGSTVLKGALEAAALQGSDEASHALIGYDPEQTASSVLANMGYAGIMGGATGGLFGLGDITASKGLKAIEDGKMVSRAEDWLGGYGTASKGIKLSEEELKQLSSEARHGYKFGSNPSEPLVNFAVDKAGHTIAESAGSAAGAAVLGPAGAVTGYNLSRGVLDPILDKILKKPMTSMTKSYVVPQLTKVLTSDSVKALPSAIQYGLKAAKGAKLMDKAMDYVFVPGMQQAFDHSINSQMKERIKQNIEDSVMDQQIRQPETPPGFATGGEVGPQDDFASTFPNENMLLQAAKARVYNHLKMLKPQEKQGLIFDHKAPTKQQEKVYDQALNIATNPLSIMKHVKDGSLSSSHVIHMNQMWPELNDQLKKKATERITEMQLKGEKPSYKVRQGLAVLMGAPLESCMTPQSILAAQRTFIKPMPNPGQNSPSPTGGKNKRGTSTLSKVNQPYKTPNQAGEADQAVRK